MAKFKYISLDKEGRELSGVIESTSENRARKELARVESNHIGLRTCEAILQLLGGQFFIHRVGDDFSAEFVLPVTPPDTDG